MNSKVLVALADKKFIEYSKSLFYSAKVDGLWDGDFVIIKRVETANNGDTVVALVNNEATLKRYYKRKNGIELHPQNTEFDIIRVNSEDEFQINGIVLAVFREYDRN